MVNATEDENNGNRLKAGKQPFAPSIHYPVPGVSIVLTSRSVSSPGIAVLPFWQPLLAFVSAGTALCPASTGAPGHFCTRSTLPLKLSVLDVCQRAVLQLKLPFPKPDAPAADKHILDLALFDEEELTTVKTGEVCGPSSRPAPRVTA